MSKQIEIINFKRSDIITEDCELVFLSDVKPLLEALEKIEIDQWILLRNDLDQIQDIAREALEPWREILEKMK